MTAKPAKLKLFYCLKCGEPLDRMLDVLKHICLPTLRDVRVRITEVERG